jgi:hypothetical protein
VSADVVSAEEARDLEYDANNVATWLRQLSREGATDDLAIARRLHASSLEHVARLARAVVTLHRELAVLRAQLPPLCAVHDALREAAALPGAGASGEEMVAAVRAQGAEAMRAKVLSATVLCTRACEASLKSGTMDERIRALLEVVASAHDLWVDLPLPGAEVSRG